MSAKGLSNQFFIGWDVGGWNCDKNVSSRDAIVILDSNLSLAGKPWRGNLRSHINQSKGTREFMRGLFSFCDTQLADTAQVSLAIDTPLGFSREFVALMAGFSYGEPLESSGTNPYLFRQTERYLFERGITPLSAIKDMIGSQATKGMHMLAKFAPRKESCGIWSDGEFLTALEAYPAACKGSPLIRELLGRYVLGERIDPPGRQWIEPIDHQDKLDALTCALIAFLSVAQPDTLAQPPDSIPMSEGWIWVPTDTLQPDARKWILID
jgi:hypothetical protein